jgi:hypothetical protein
MIKTLLVQHKNQNISLYPIIFKILDCHKKAKEFSKEMVKENKQNNFPNPIQKLFNLL